MTVTGSQVPAGNEVLWYMGGAEATLIEEDLVVDASGYITLTKKAEFGSVFVVDSSDDPTDTMLELQDGAAAFAAATETTGTEVVDVHTDASGNTVTAYYVDIETTALVQVMACKDVSTSMDVDTLETEVHGQVQKLKKTGAATRTASLEEVDYDDVLIGAIFGDYVSDSPVAGDKKWTDNFTSVKKISVLVGKQTVSGVLTKKWFLMGCQVTNIEHSFPTADFYTDSLEFLVDYMVSTTLVPN